MKERAAVGFSVHTGWAASVLVAGSFRAPRVLDRRRIRLSDSDDTVVAQVYHRAVNLPEAKAESFVREAQKQALRHALAEIRSLSDSYPLVAAGVMMSAVTLPSKLSAILRSHPLLHTAEGALYREALAGGADKCGLEVVRIPRRELGSRFASALGMDDEEASEWLAQAGRAIGPPWARDQKDAAMTALIALSASKLRKR